MDNTELMMYIAKLIRIGLMVIVGFPLLRKASSLAHSFFAKHLSRHIALLLSRIIFYIGLTFIAIAILHELGFNVTALLGAAGVLGVAIGFASQTSVSNIISGLFLVLERPFSIGDTIKVSDVMGVVESINLLCVNVRTLDNKLIRIPNELLFKSTVTTRTYYPARRIECVLSVSYDESSDDIKTRVTEVIKANKLFLSDPAPSITMYKLDRHGYDPEIRQFFMIWVWVAKENYIAAPAVLMQQLKNQFDSDKTTITIVQSN